MTPIPAPLAEALRDRYRLERELGRGGMGEVYLAEDLKHRRKVALKVLRPEIAGVIGRERFLREIEVAARLQHPTILTVHDSGEADGYLYYVMPYVEGESLRERLARLKELPVEDAERILYELLDALAYAHAKGVVHRDIKPDNIMLSGRHALLLDFGVAKALTDAADPSFVTTTGLALGTPSYMAPEQAMADKAVDHRADIYAVGVVGYELLAGRRPFIGNTAQQIVASQMTQVPEDLRVHRPAVPALLATTIMRALERNPADRWQSATEMLGRIETLLTPSGESPPAVFPVKRSRMRKALVFGAIGAGALLAVAAGVMLTRPRQAPALQLGRRVQLTFDPGLEIEPAMSPDGRFVAYAAGEMSSLEIRVRQLDGGAALSVAAGSARPQRMPYWSPDGGRILFSSPRGLEVVSTLGGPARLLVPDRPGGDPWGSGGPLLPAGWSPDGKSIAFVRSDTLYVQDQESGRSRPLAHGGEMHSFTWSPDGRWIACVRGNRQSRQPSFLFGNLAPARIWLVPVAQAQGDPVPVTDETWFNASPTWPPDGRALLFLSNRAGGVELYRVRLRANGEPDGDPVRVTNGLRAQAVSMAANGSWIAYADWSESSNVWSLPIPSQPPVSVRQAEPVTSGNQVIEAFDVSPDGRWLLFDSDRSGNQDLYRMSMPGGEPERLTDTPADEFWPQLSPDGRDIAYLAFTGVRRHLFLMSFDGRDRRQITDGADDERTATWSPDGRSLYFLHNFNGADPGLWSITRAADGTWGRPRPLFNGTSYVPVASPDGRLVAFSSLGSVMVVGSTGDSARALVPRTDPAAPRAAYVGWSEDSRTVYYLAPEPGEAGIWSVPVSGGTPRLLVRFDDPTREWHRYGFLARGGRFYFTVGDRQSDVWAAEVVSAR